MGEDINTLEHEDNPLQRDIEFIFNRIARRLTFAFPYWRLLRLPVDRANDASAARIREAIAGFIARARRRLADNPALRMKPSNMLEALVVARDEPESGFTDAHVIGNAIGIVFAGEDTTSNSIAWLLNFLAHHPQAAANLADEADRVLGNAKVLQDFHQLEQFPYLEAANKESMRLKPVAPALALETNKDVVIADALVPAGTIVVGLLRYSAECDLGLGQEFQPERWLSQQHSTDSDPARKFFPFGGGPRFCPGRYLALAEIKMVMSMLARNFKLQPIKDVPPVEENFTFTMTPSALPVLLRVRTDTWHVAGLGQSLEDYPQIRE
jgi:cytochrome P450